MEQRRGRAFWTQEIEQWRASGQSGRIWSASRGYPVEQLYSWSGRLRRAERASGEAFSEVEVRVAGESRFSAEVFLGGGKSLRFSGEVSESQLRALFRAAGTC